MKKIIIPVLWLLTTALSGLAQTSPAPAVEKAITLDDCIVSLLKNNLGLAAEILTPEMNSFAVRKAGEVFLPKLSIAYTQSSERSASYSFIQSADQISTQTKDATATLSQLFPTGGTLKMSMASYRQDSTESYLTINPVYSSTLTFDFTQPLLRNFGPTVTKREILIARNDRAISVSQFQTTLMETIFSVEEAYWNLVYSRENLLVKQESLKLARDLLAKNTRELEVGTIPPLDLLSARAEVASREADIIQAQAEVRDNQNILRNLINLPREKGAPAPVLLPSDKPKTDPVVMDQDEAIGAALAHRPDLASLRTTINTKNLNLGYAKNQLLPTLNLEVQYWSPGISGTEILYQDNDPLTGVVIGTIPGGGSQAFKDALHFKYKNWSVGLTLDIPLESLFSRAQYYQARLDTEQATLRYRDQEQKIGLEVETVLLAVESDFKQMQAYGLARELAEEKLKAEEKKLKAGLSTNYTVLQQQRDLATARGNEIKAMIDFNISLAKMEKVLGTTLARKNIHIAGTPKD